MSETHSAEKGVCDGCQKRPCVCETVVLPSAENDTGLAEHKPTVGALSGGLCCEADRDLPPGRGDE